MIIRTIRHLGGPNIYLYRPVLVMELDLEDLAGRETREIAGFNERLLTLLPGLQEHVCGLGVHGGLVRRLEDGTFFGHVVEHVALELSTPAAVPVNFGKTRVTDNPRVYNVIVEATNAPVMRLLLRLAVDVVSRLVRGDDVSDLPRRIDDARRLLDATALGPSTAAIADAAHRRGIPVVRLNDESLVQLGYGVHRRFIQSTVASTTSSVSVEIASDKQLTRELLTGAFIPTPWGGVAATEAEALALFEQIDAPVVVKPLNGNQGRAVTIGVTAPGEVIAAFRAATAISSRVVVEERLTGRDYRVIVVGGRFVAASERVPAQVIGDGRSTVEALIARVNRDPRRGESHEKPLTRIVLDEPAHAQLAAQGLRATDIPAAGRVVPLRATANLSTGGTARDVSDDVHPDIVMLCERAARVIGLDICGLDLIAPDISRPLPDRGAGFVEVNAGPGIRMHHHPSEGQPRDVGAAIVDMLFPAGQTGRIPVVSITGTNGKTTTARMLAHAFSVAGQVAGLTTTDGVYVAGRPVACGDMTGPRSARAVLGDPAVQVAVLETARGGIVRGGLGYDWSDVGVVTNIQADHLGQDGITSVDDLVHIKSLVAERVREGGTLVLNADDERAVSVADLDRVRRVPKSVVWYSLHPHGRLVDAHLTAGGTAYFPRNGWIVEARGQVLQPICRIADIPCTLGGAAQFNLSNALAAVGAGRAMGLDPAVLASALASFAPERENPGRANLFAVRDGYVLLDYGHNPAAMAAVAGMLGLWRGRRVTCVFGLPGDRLDKVACDAVAAAAHAFHRIIVREDRDRRGRQPGEMANLITREVAKLCPNCDCTVIADERAAMCEALESMQADELVVVFYDDHHEVHKILAGAGATPAAAGLAALPSRHVSAAGAATSERVDRRHSRRPVIASARPEQWA